MPAPIAPIGDFQLPALVEPQPSSGAPSSGGGFGKALAGELQKLNDSQGQAATDAQALATGQAQDVSSVVMSVEKASLELQLASQIRNKAVEAYQDVFRMQV